MTPVIFPFREYAYNRRINYREVTLQSQSLNSMMLEEKKNLYENRFPEILAKRMCDQMDTFHSVNRTNSSGYLSLFFCKNINHTAEGGRFWSQIAELYMNRNSPDLAEIREIVTMHGIEP